MRPRSCARRSARPYARSSDPAAPDPRSAAGRVSIPRARGYLGSRPGRAHDSGPARQGQRSACGARRPLEVVKAPAPALLVRADRLLAPEAAVREADRGDAVVLLEVELDQLAGVVAVP